MHKRVFVSSTYIDLAEFREAVQRTIRQLGAVDISMENFGARDERPKTECMKLIADETDFFIGIYAHRYGYIPKSESVSITEAEYDAATSAGVPRLIYLIDETIPWVLTHVDKGRAEKKLRTFKDKLKANHICQLFSNKDQLAAKVAADLGRYFSIRSLPRITKESAEFASAGLEAVGPFRTFDLDDSSTELDMYRKEIYENSRSIFLVHVLTPTTVKNQAFDVFIYLVRHSSDDLSDIKQAEFFLGSYWGNKVFRVRNEGSNIGITTSAHGTFACICRVTFTDGFQTTLSRYIDFEMESMVR